MVNEDWMEKKIIEFERNRSEGQWTDIREQQLNYLMRLYKSGSFAEKSQKNITEKLLSIFHGF